MVQPLTLLCPLLRQELPRFQELIFEDFARFILVENTYEEVVLQTVMKDILQGEQGGAARKNRAALANGAQRGAETPGGGCVQTLACLRLKFPLWVALLRVVSVGHGGCQL